MSTRSGIGLLRNEEVRYIYCHHDGYVTGVGRLLFLHYPSPEQVDSLLALGDLSSLGATPDECTAYFRDYEAPWDEVQPLTVCEPTFSIQAFEAFPGLEFIYLLKEDEPGSWNWYYQKRGDASLVPVSQSINIDEVTQ